MTIEPDGGTREKRSVAVGALERHGATPSGLAAERSPGVRPIPVMAGLTILAVLVSALALAPRATRPPDSWASTQPAIAGDFPDPGILVAGGRYYAYATNGNGKHIQMARSSDLRQWELLPDALPLLPSWVAPDSARVWAPEVIAIGSQFVMYYTAHDRASDRQCIGVATSARPEGPFRDTRTRPFLCQPELGGTIDGSPFREGDALYLYFKSDGNCCGIATHLWGQRPISGDSDSHPTG